MVSSLVNFLGLTKSTRKKIDTTVTQQHVRKVKEESHLDDGDGRCGKNPTDERADVQSPLHQQQQPR